MGDGAIGTTRSDNNMVEDTQDTQEEILVIDTIEQKLPNLNIKLLTLDEINNGGNGLPYLLTGRMKEHMGILANSLDAIINLKSGLSDEQFKTLVTIEINNMKTDIQELVDGMNTLYKIVTGNNKGE